MTEETEYSRLYDDNGGHGHWVKAYLTTERDVAVRCFRVREFDPEDGTVNASDLLVSGTIHADGRAYLKVETGHYADPDDATRAGLAMRRCYEAASEILGEEAASWNWNPEPGGWRTHPDAIEIAEQKREA